MPDSPPPANEPVGDDISLSGDAPCESLADCLSGQYCSTAQVCVPEGRCAHDQDCTASGFVCAPHSKLCVPAGSCQVDEDCGDGQLCDPTTMLCGAGSACGSSEYEADRLPPNVMLLLDRSGSMRRDDGSGVSRWEIAKSALFQVLDELGQSARFGLTSYSACIEGGCASGVTEVSIGDDGAASIRSFLEPRTACGYKPDAHPNNEGEICYLCSSGDPETSTGKSLAALVGQPELQATERDNFVVLLTDGHESHQCVDGDVDGARGAALLLQQPVPVPTYVIGFSGDVNETELISIAQEGGTNEPLLASDLDALREAFQSIVAQVQSCEFVLRDTPPDPDELYVFLDEAHEPLARDVSDGWSYSPVSNSVILSGQSCANLRAPLIEDVSIVYGCPERVVR